MLGETRLTERKVFSKHVSCVRIGMARWLLISLRALTNVLLFRDIIALSIYIDKASFTSWLDGKRMRLIGLYRAPGILAAHHV